jgi:hypothetical protein
MTDGDEVVSHEPLGTALVYSVLRILERWMEYDRERPQELDLDAIVESALRHALGGEECAKRKRRKRS